MLIGTREKMGEKRTSQARRKVCVKEQEACIVLNKWYHKEVLSQK